MSDIVDLDVFIPEPRIIKFAGEEIKVESPRTVDLIQLGFLAEKLGEPNQTDEEIEKALDLMTERISKIIPQLAGKQLTKAQLQKLVDILSDMAMPQSARALLDQGITRDTPKKVQ